MTEVRDFIADLLRAGTSVKDPKKLADNTFREKALKIRAIFKILKQISAGENTDDRRKFNSKKTVRTSALIADDEADRRICIKKSCLSSWHIFWHHLHKDLGLVKKSARWVPKLLSQEQKEKRMETSAAFIQMIKDKGTSFLGNIITMDESAMSMQTPETKSQSKQWTN